MPTTTILSRRTTLLAGVGLALGATVLPAVAQPPAQPRTPENEARWARMGVALAGKTALVTGSTDGLGKEVARQLGALGAQVIVHGRNQERGEEVVRAIRAAGGEAVFYRADLASLASVEEFAAEDPCSGTTGSTCWSTMRRPSAERSVRRVPMVTSSRSP